MTDGQGRWIGGRRSARMLFTALAAAVLALALASPSAPALTTHSFATEFSIGGNCGQSGYGEQFAGPHDLATDAAGNLYVMCSGKGPNGLWGSIRKFHPNGTPYPFTGNAPYVEGNEINEDPVAPRKSFGEKAWIAVDRSSARPGWIYVADSSTGLEDPPNTGGGPKASEHVDIFNPAGEYVTSLTSNEFQANTRGVGVDDEGYVYVGWEGSSHYIAKYNPATFREIARILPSTPEGGTGGPCCTIVHPDSNGAVWVGWCGGYDCEPTAEFGKYEADQWTTDLRPVSKNPDAIVAEESPFLKEGFPGVDCPPPFEYAPRACQLIDGDVTQFSGNFNVDLRDNNVFTVGGGVVTSYSEGNAEDPVHQNGPTFGESFLGGRGRAITIDNEGNVWVGTAPSKIVKFAPGPTLPKVITRPVTLADIGHYTATVHLQVDPDGGGPVTQCNAAYDLLSSSSYGSSVSCNTPTPYGQATEVTATLTGLEPGKKYRVRGEAANAAGTGLGAPRGFEARAVLDVETNPATGVGRNEATLNGQLDADGIPTEYWYQYGPTSFYGLTTLDSQGKGVAVTGAPGEIKQAPFTLNHLQSGRVYHFRLVARNELGVTVGQDRTLRTVSPPEIAGVGAEHVTDTEADLHAQINPVGYPTTYFFEYGTTPAYGSTIPISGNELIGNTPQKVEVHLTGLPAGNVIHYRVVATNEWGTNSSDDTTFSFSPPSCPNAHIRQVTGTSYLPDCRAYELVSPGYAGAVQFLPGEALTNFGGTFTLEGVIQTPQNLGYARSPSRFMYWGGLGAINGINTPNSFLDVYLATRTTTGWVTAMPGLKGNETQFSWGRVCSEDLSICADHIGSVYVKNPETGLEEEIPKSQAPYLYRADATKLGRVPSNVAVIPKGAELAGDWMFSGDFSHFVFSTQTRFTPDGITARPGSVYDNDIGAGTLEVISKDANNNDIAPEPSQAGDPRRVTGIVAVSNNGSRVLMAGTTNPSCKASEHFGCPHVLNYPVRLYLRNVPAKVTYEVSEGHEVNYVGTTADGRTVFFTSTEQLTPGDNDTSRDLYMWDETDGQIHLISRNGSLGNDDACAASWVGKCGVLPLTPLYTDYSEHFDFKTRVEGIDDVLARNSGDIYFYSPEDLVPGEVGGDGQRNLYLYRNGQLHLVSTLEPGAGVERSTISQDGSHAAFMTRSNLTAYDSHGQKEVYAYNAETGVLRCASCNPNGKAPKQGGQVITVAEAGHFMSDDGRVFFGTKEALVPQDTDGIRDVYEYVDGRAQLITSGTGQRENTGGLELFSFFFGTLQVGLESVSRDGTDVYFATFETLTPEDKNGSFLKFYDARTGGGFDFTPDLGPCAAADECHGASSQPPVRASVGTGAAASGGNLPMPGKQKKKHHRKKHHRHHAKRQGGGRNG